MYEGWIKLHRKFLAWEWYSEPNMVTAFIHCLLKANHRKKKWRGKVIERGQFITGISKFGSETGLSYQQVRTAWGKLESTGEITTQSTNQGTVITVVNYPDYQDFNHPPENGNNPDNSEVSGNQESRQQSNNNQITTTNNDKNEKKESVDSSGADFPKACTHLEQAKTVAKYLLESIKEWDPGHKYNHNPPSKSAMNGWILEIERAMRIDGRTKKQLLYMIHYLFNKDTEATRFWAPNIQSGEKLRLQFEKVKNEIKKETGADRQPKKLDESAMTPEKLEKKGYLSKDAAQKYSQENFREALEDTLSMFKIFNLNGEDYYKPLS